MSWESIDIKNWESLRNVSLELGNFTVIVGRSSCGKSAFTRAIQALTSNVRGSDFISVGETKASVSAIVDGTRVTLERKEAGGGSYKISYDDACREEVFTKLAGGVPEKVTEILGFEPITTDSVSTNFAAQDDPPFLKKESGASVARVLGELTNVSKIFDAVREANRRKLNASSTLSTRKKDLDSVKKQISTFGDIRKKLFLQNDAERLLATLEEVVSQEEKLARVIKIYELATNEIEEYHSFPELPDTYDLEELHQKLRFYSQSLLEWSLAKKRTFKAGQDLTECQEHVKALEEEFSEALGSHGVCPLCGRAS